MKCLILIFLATFSFNIFAQEHNPIDFFPHHEGDIFEYVLDYPNHFQNIITRDSLGDDGKYYVKMDSQYFSSFCIDTLESMVYLGPVYEAPIFKLDADSGDTWAVLESSTNILIAEVIDLFPIIILGVHDTVKVIEYNYFNLPDTTDEFYFQAYWLSKQFGIVKWFGDPPYEPVYSLRGAKIDGVTYGVVTSIEDEEGLIPADIVLHQNYPNPFNPSTTIKFTIPKGNENIRSLLKVYDVLGEEIATLVNEYKPPGTYEIKFNAESVKRRIGSGVYFYRLESGKFFETRKMLLLK